MASICTMAWVYGSVQGVGFRYSTQREALQLGVTGYARNLDDGGVEVLACGEAEQVEKLIAWLKAGGRAARGLTSVNRTPSTHPQLGQIRDPLLDALHRLRQAGDFSRLFGGSFREQAIEIAAVAFLFAKLVGHRLDQHTDRRRGVKFKVKLAHKAHYFPVFNGERYPFLRGNDFRHRLAPLGGIFQIAFAIRFNFVAFKNKHDFSHTA